MADHEQRRSEARRDEAVFARFSRRETSNTSVMHSTDGGVTWTHDPGVTGGAVLDSVYAASDRVYIVGENGAIGVRQN